MNAAIETPQAAARRLSARKLQTGYLPMALHEYRDADGEPAFWRIRLKHSDTGDKWIRPMRRDGVAYILSEPEAPPAGKPLYRPAVPVVGNRIAWVVEGEACADASARLGIEAYTSGGTDSVGTADWSPLQGRSVRVWPDNDAAGAKYAAAVVDRLRALGCAVEVVEVAALNLPDKGDCVDWLREHSRATFADLLALPLVAETMATETLSGKQGAEARSEEAPRVILRRGSEVQPVAVDWLWPGWLAAGKMHLIAGAPGTGKTTIATALAATVTQGGHWPDGSRAEVGSVVIWSGEDDNADTLNPRLRAAGADMSRVHVVEGVQADGRRYPFDPAQDMDALREAMLAIPDARLIIFDPIVSAVAGDGHKSTDVRRGLQPLVDLAAVCGCALLGVTHFTKGTAGRDPVERITGSLAFGAVTRVAMVTAKQEADGDRPERRVILRAKSNIGPDGGGFAYDLRQGELPGFPGVIASRVMWGEAVAGSARELLAEAESCGDEVGHDAAGFLRALLAPGSRAAKEVFAEASAAGFSKDAMHRAKRKIGAVAVKQGMATGWAWRLPEGGGKHPEGGEDGAPNCAQPSQPSGEAAPSSDEGMEVIEL